MTGSRRRKPGDDALRLPEPAERSEILLIDDNADYLLLIRRTLELHDPTCRVTGVTTPEEAYALLDERPFDLVLLDYKFEKGNGLEVIRTLKDKSEFVPTVMVTAFGDEGLAVQCMREGALDFVPKTSGFVQALPEIVTRAIERGRIIRERIRARVTLQRRNQELQVFSDVVSVINASHDAEEILELATKRLIELLGARAGAIHVVDEAGSFLTALSGVEPGSAEDRIDLAEQAASPLARAVRRRESCFVSEDESGRARLFVPLVSKRTAIGVLSFVLPPGAEVTLSERALATSIGKQVGDAVAHARLHADLLVTEDYLNDLVTNAADEIVTLDPWGKITTWNTGAEAIYGYSADQMVGRDWETLWPENRRHEPRELARRVLERGETVRNRKMALLTSGGRLVDILLTLSPLRRPDGGVRGVACIGKDISRQEQLQAQLVQSEKMAAVGQLISGVAHELNNPLTGVLGYAQLVASTDTGERLKGYLERIATEAARCQRIVQNLLSFARKHVPRAERLAVNGVVSETLELRSYDLRVSNVDVMVDLEQELPTTLADAHQLQQVFINLINNAQQAMLSSAGQGRLVITTRLDENRQEGRPELVVAFDDDGPGVPQELREKIFDPFFTTKQVGEGTGLGLSLSWGIVREHGGRLTLAESELGGARFEVRLPVMPEIAGSRQGGGREKGVAVLASAGAERLEGRATAAPRTSVAHRVLLVDEDAPEVRGSLAEALESEGHSISLATNVGQALERLACGESYDFIVADLAGADPEAVLLHRGVRELHPHLARRTMFTHDAASADELRRLVARPSPPAGVEELRMRVSSFFQEHA